ncbi:MAG: FprA family A-type flavoprotein [Oscillospiraceae bacterium]
MSAVKIIDNVYSVGALNPSLRVFDIVMATEYGTSYNSFLVKGNNKTALVEGCHKTFYKQFLANIEEVCDFSQIDYIILNHNEPDHTGALAELIVQNPDVEIFCSQAGSLYIKNITNLENLHLHVIKDGETLDLGGKTMRFITAPFLHWPDSMFTYLEEDKLLFSCDFLGCHYCEPYTFDANITRQDSYKTAVKGYYDAIFGPFPTYVRKGLDKIRDLPMDFVCTSHGPILTREGQLPFVLEQYEKWCTPHPNENPLIPVFFCSAYGNTRRLATEIAEGILQSIPNAKVQTYDIIKHDMAVLADLLNRSDAFALGSPTLNRDAVPPTWQLLSHLDAVNCGKKPVLLFGSYGWSGEAVGHLKARLEGVKMKVFAEEMRTVFVPTEDDLQKARVLGKEFGESLQK